jgi:hypothetical protein
VLKVAVIRQTGRYCTIRSEKPQGTSIFEASDIACTAGHRHGIVLTCTHAVQ